ncbi:MAG: hypothetical protein L2C94_005300 [Aigarchaeota archaeon]|nr:hypothetical protein [Candidatus Wolframiiraptor gerlachensis]
MQGAVMKWITVLAEYIPSDIATRFASAVKQIIVEVVNFLTPILTIIGAGMIILGVALIAARQEFYGIRLITSGGITLILTYIVIPVILSLL